MSKEGALWFPDLTLPDYTGMLPVFLGLANLANIEVHYHQCLLNSNFCGFLLFWVRFTWIRIFKGRVLISTQGKRIWCIHARTKFIYILHLTRSNWETCVIYSICIYMTVSNLTMYTVRLVRGCIGMAWSQVRFLPDGSACIIHNCSSLRLKMYINLRSNIPTTKTRPYL
jgi:hypothetical protein